MGSLVLSLPHPNYLSLFLSYHLSIYPLNNIISMYECTYLSIYLLSISHALSLSLLFYSPVLSLSLLFSLSLSHTNKIFLMIKYIFKNSKKISINIMCLAHHHHTQIPCFCNKCRTRKWLFFEE